MKVLQFGYGNYGKFHAEAWLSQGHSLQVVDPARAGVSHLREYKSVLDKDTVVLKHPKDWNVDCIDIVTPPNTHVEMLEYASRSLQDALGVYFLGKGILRHGFFVEKPLEVNSVGVFPFKTFVGYGYRFAPGVARLKKLKPQAVKIEWFGKKRPNWTYEDLIRNDGVHIFDLFRYITGRWPEKHEYFLSNTIKGDYTDPVLPGCRTTKFIKSEAGIVDFSTIHPVTLLTEQFKKLESGGIGLHTLEESIELTKFTNEVVSGI